MRHKGLFVALAILAVMGLAFFAGVIAFVASGGHRTSPFSILSGSKVGVVSVDGPIVSSERAIEDLEDARKNKAISCVILRIESPGGAVGASQEIMEAVRKLAKEKPVVASMGSVAASGGYYIALGATRILANPATITGSIGVRMEHVMLADLFKWARISHETLKSGKFKDMGSYDRPLSTEERRILEGGLEDIHQQFKEAVVEARHLTPDVVASLADGRIYTGRQALSLGLIDGIGGFVEAIRAASELGGIQGEPELVYPDDHDSFMKRFFADAQSFANTLATRVVIDTWEPLMALPAPNAVH